MMIFKAHWLSSHWIPIKIQKKGGKLPNIKNPKSLSFKKTISSNFITVELIVQSTIKYYALKFKLS